MWMISNLFGRRSEKRKLMLIVNSLLKAATDMVNEVQSIAYDNEEVLLFQTYAEVYSALLHYLSRVSLHVGGAAFQDSIYVKIRNKIIDFLADMASKILKISPRSAIVELKELCFRREVEYAKYSSGYGGTSTCERSLILAMATNIHEAAGISVSNDKEVIERVGNIIAKLFASLDLDIQLKKLDKV